MIAQREAAVLVDPRNPLRPVSELRIVHRNLIEQCARLVPRRGGFVKFAVAVGRLITLDQRVDGSLLRHRPTPLRQHWRSE